MSVDILSNISKDVVSKKGVTVDSKVEVPEKKEGSSLFDSLMKDIQKEKQTTPTENKKTSEKSENKDNKVNIENQPKQTKTKEENIEASKKVSQELVDLVVDSAKNKSKKGIGTAKNTESTKIDTQSKSNEETKLKVDGKVTIIKEAVEDIKKEISKIGKEINTEDLDKSKEISKTSDSKEDKEKSTKIDTQSKSNEETKLKVDGKATIIKEAVEDITKEVSKIGKEEVQTTTTLKTNEEIKLKVDGKVTIIKEAVEDIKKEISKIGKEEVQTTTKIKETVGDVLKVENSEENGTLNQNIKSINGDNEKETSKNIVNQNQLVVNGKISKDEATFDSKTTLLANGFLNSQQKSKETVSLTQVLNAKDNIEKNKTLKSVKDSANMLDLNAEKMGVEHSDQSGKVEKIDILSKQDRESQLQMIQSRGLSRFMIQKDSMINDEQLKRTAELEKVSSVDEQVQKEKNVTLNVPQAVVETIQSKIIGAQQKVGSFMSEVARNMYLNYKPPFTSFRMNLNPENLGSIAVIMRASKNDNSVSVSMNMNNTSTMEVFAENKNSLQSALQRQLGEGSNVTLNFDMQNGNSGGQFGQSSQNNSSNSQNTTEENVEEAVNIIEEEDSQTLEYL
jgi:hypothetical protein